MLVTMKSTAADAKRVYLVDKTYRVPQDMPRQLADEWLSEGFAVKAERDAKPSGPEVATVEPDEDTTRSRGNRRAKG